MAARCQPLRSNSTEKISRFLKEIAESGRKLLNLKMLCKFFCGRLMNRRADRIIFFSRVDTVKNVAAWGYPQFDTWVRVRQLSLLKFNLNPLLCISETTDFSCWQDDNDISSDFRVWRAWTHSDHKTLPLDSCLRNLKLLPWLSKCSWIRILRDETNPNIFKFISFEVNLTTTFRSVSGTILAQA